MRSFYYAVDFRINIKVDNADKDDVSATLFPHVRKNSLRDVYCSKEVYIHNAMELFLSCKFYSTRNTHSCIADEDVNHSLFVNDLLNSSRAVLWIGDIAVDMSDANMIYTMSGKFINLITFVSKIFSSSFANTRTAAGNNHCFHAGV